MNPARKKSVKRAAEKYRMSAKHRAAQKRYRQTPSGRAKKNELLTQRRLRNREAINKLKAKPCTDCGGTFDPVCMDFDHRPSEQKRGNVSALVTRGFSRILIEIEKCDLVCANCHRIRTKTRGRSPVWRKKRHGVTQLGLELPEAS